MFQRITEEKIADFLVDNKWEGYRGTSAAQLSDNQLLHNNLGGFLGKKPKEVSAFFRKVSDIAKAQIQDINGILSSFELLEKQRIKKVNSDGKGTTEDHILALDGKEYTDAASWNQEEYLLYHFVVLTLLYLRVKKGFFNQELEELELDSNEDALYLLAREMHITINAYKICETCISLSQQEKDIQQFIQSYLEHVLNSNEKEHCFPGGSELHALYLVLIHYKRRDILHLRIDNSSRDAVIVLEKKSPRTCEKLFAFLLKIVKGFRIKNHAIRYLYSGESAEKYGFTKLADGGYSPRKKQHMPNCSVSGFRIQMSYRLANKDFYAWLIGQEKQFTTLDLYSFTARDLQKKAAEKSYRAIPLALGKPKIEKSYTNFPVDNLKEITAKFCYTPCRISRYPSFAKIAQQGGYLVDKTLFIKRFMEDMEDVELQLITRPPCFGKTLNMAMLCEFLSKTIDGKPNPYKKIFRAFAIGQKGERAFFEKYFAKYHVIFFTLKDLDASDYEITFYELHNKISEQYKKFVGIEKEELISLGELDANNKLHAVYLKKSLQSLAMNLKKNLKGEVVILIDAYDHPLQKSTCDIKARELILGFLSDTLKEGCYHKGLLTGISHVVKEGLYPNLNYCKVYTVQEDRRYYSDFGMTKAEVEDMISWRRKQGIESGNFTIMPEKTLRKNYGGYLVGVGKNRLAVYATWSVMNYLSSYRVNNYWEETGTTKLLDLAIQLYKKENFLAYQKLHEEFVMLLRKGHVTVEVSIRSSYENLPQKKSIFWTLLVDTGLITVQSYHDAHNGKDSSCTLVIPNKSLRNSLNEKRILWFSLYEEELLQKCSKELYSTYIDIIVKGLEKLRNINEMNEVLEEKSVALLGHKEKEIREAAKAALEGHHKHRREVVKNQYIQMLSEQQEDLVLFAWKALEEHWLSQERDRSAIQCIVLERLKNSNKLLPTYISCLESQGWLYEESTFTSLLEGYSLCRERESWECYWQHIWMLAVERESLSSILLKKYPEWIAHETIGKYTSQQVLFLKKILLEEEKLFSYVSALYNTSTIEKEVCFYLIKNLLEGLPRYQGSIFADWLAIIFNTDRTEEFREKMLSMTVEFNISLVKQASIAFIEKLCGKAVQEGEFTELLRNQLLLIVSQYGASLGLKKEFSDLCNFYLEKIASCHNNASTVKSILKILLNISAIIKLFYLENAERENTFIGCLLGVIQLDDAEILQVSSSILKQVAFNEAQRNAIIQKLGQSYESYSNTNELDKAAESLKGLYLFIHEEDKNNAVIFELLFSALETIDSDIRKTAFKLLIRYFCNNVAMKKRLIDYYQNILEEREWLSEQHQYEEVVEQAIELGISQEAILNKVAKVKLSFFVSSRSESEKDDTLKETNSLASG